MFIISTKNSSQSPFWNSFKLVGLIGSETRMPNNSIIFEQGTNVTLLHSDQFRFTKTKTFERAKHKKAFGCIFLHVVHLAGFFSGGGGGLGVPPSGENFANPPHLTLVPVFGPRLAPPPAEVRPRKFEKLKYIFVSKLTTFKLKSTLKTCISCLK